VKFNEYLKSCREHTRLTQEQLVEALYSYDKEAFAGLEGNTLSKWERGVIKPKITRQVTIIRYFQKETGFALPCWHKYSVEEAEKLICKSGMKNLLGKSKELILNFPENETGPDHLEVYQLRTSEMLDSAIKLHMDLDQTYNHGTTHVKASTFREWALHPSNSFFYCEYLGQFFGLLFTLRLKQNSFEKMMRCEIQEKDLTFDDFASFDEMGSNYIFSFFAMNEKASSILFIHYYAHLIANQMKIKEIGVATMMNDAKKLIESISLKYFASLPLKEGLVLETYRESLPDFLTSEKVIKMIFSQQPCPEE
jgi:transcriptional regulator with XRE-family HTH domain